MLRCVSIVHKLLLLGGIPLNEYTLAYLSIHLLMSICVTSSFEQLH